MVSGASKNLGCDVGAENLFDKYYSMSLLNPDGGDPPRCIGSYTLFSAPRYVEYVHGSTYVRQRSRVNGLEYTIQQLNDLKIRMGLLDR